MICEIQSVDSEQRNYCLLEWQVTSLIERFIRTSFPGYVASPKGVVLLLCYVIYFLRAELICNGIY
jgi:hypothetical protein